MRHTSAVLGLLLLAGAACGHPGHDHSSLRVWKEAGGAFEIEASFVLARDGEVQLCTHDGTIVRMPLEGLSEEDGDYVRNRLRLVRRVNAPPEPDSRTETVVIPTQPSFAVVGWSVVGLLFVGTVVASRKGSKRVLGLLLVVGPLSLLAIAQPLPDTKASPQVRKHFEAFKGKLELRTDADYLYVGSNGFPDHPMMVGIRAWQQQVPLPQPYTGKNAWQIPLNPKLSDAPISGKKALFSGAIALAVNGVPIFNALNNRGEDTLLAGELDEYGGHCGRGDDYHYHAAPVHLEKTVGKGNPIAYALDGFPLYGYTDADGKAPADLDEYNGRMEKTGYRYYSTKTFPYINGGMRGVVTVRNDRIDPQPRDVPIRPAGRPLRGAKITDFVRDDATQTYTLKYELQGKTLSWKYTIGKDGVYTFVYTDRDGKESSETYRRREGKDGPPPKKDGKEGKGGPRPKKDD